MVSEEPDGPGRSDRGPTERWVYRVPIDPGTVVAVPLLAVLARIAWTDLGSRRIENRAVAAVLALWPLQLALIGLPQPWYAGPLGGAGVLLAGLVLWRLGLVGGGDVKLLAALAVLVGPGQLLGLLLVTTLAGGLLALALLYGGRAASLLGLGLGRLLPAGLAGRVATLLPGAPAAAPASVPYGLALAVGGAWWALHLLA